MSTATQAAPRIYRGRSVEELIPKIQAELGEDAIVLRRRKGLTGGIGGFFQRPFVEIEAQPGPARIDLFDEDGGAPALPDTSQPAPISAGFAGAYVTDALANLAAAGSPAARSDAQPPPVAGAAQSPPVAGATDPSEEQEFRELTPESLLAGSPAAYDGAEQAPAEDPFATALAAAETAAQTVQPRDLRTQTTHELEPATHDAADIARNLVPVADEVAPGTHDTTQVAHGRTRTKIEQSLLDMGFDRQFAAELIEAAVVHTLALNPRLGLARAVRSALMQRIPVCPPLPAASATIALVGPGGSGKTACCAALLGAYRRAGALPVACATILPAPTRGELQMLLSPTILEPTSIAAPHASRALRSARERGLLLLDLPPLSPADRGSIRTLAALLGELEPDRVVVALPATLGAKPAAQLLESLRPLGASALAITHADETDQLGVAVQAACAYGLAPEYLLDRARSHVGLTHIDPTYLADRLLS